MAKKIFLTQRTNRHVVKQLASVVSPAIYEASFGVWQAYGIDNSHLNFPWGVARDAAGNIYVCDSNNKRIVKLDSSLAYVGSFSTESSIGTPFAIYYDTANDRFMVTGIKDNLYVKIQVVLPALTSYAVSGNLNGVQDLWYRPTGIAPSFVANEWIVCGSALDLFKTTFSGGVFTSFVQQAVIGEISTWPELYNTTHYNAIIKHSGNGDLYLNNGRRIIRVNVLFENAGDSDTISKTMWGLKESSDQTLLTYNADTQTIMRFDANLNFIENVYIDSDNTIANDAYDVMDFIEVNV
jgi:NHL repeat